MRLALALAPLTCVLLMWCLSALFDSSTVYISIAGYLFMVHSEHDVQATYLEIAEGWPEEAQIGCVVTKQLDVHGVASKWIEIGPVLFIAGTDHVAENKDGTPKWADYFHQAGTDMTFSALEGRFDVNVWILAVRSYFAVILLGLLPMLVISRRHVHRLRRKRLQRLNLCVKCGYDLRANVSGTCPECGREKQKATRG